MVGRSPAGELRHQGIPSRLDGFGNGFAAQIGPIFKYGLNGFSLGQPGQHRGNRQAGAFERQFAETNFGIDNQMFPNR
jgi:hypothetical protein